MTPAAARLAAPVATLLLLLHATTASAFQRNCPAAADMMVVVQPNQPATVVLPVTNDDGSAVTVFQYPLGGELHPTGPTQLDYVFIPDRTFSGRTTLTYRVVPPRGCGNGTLLGTVTLVGGTATHTVDLGGGVTIVPSLCGTGALVVTGFAVIGVALVLFAQRRRGK